MRRRVLSKAKSGLKRGKGNEYVVVLVGGALVGLLAVVMAWLLQLVSAVPAPGIPYTSVTLWPITVLFLAGFVPTVALAVGYLLYDRYREEWQRLPDPVRSLIVGLGGALLLAGAMGIADYWYDVELWEYFLAFPLALSLVTLLTLRYYQRQGRVHDDGSSVRAVSSRTGFAQMERLATRTVSAIIGFVAAVLVGAGTQYLGDRMWLTVLVGLLAWLLTTIVMYNVFEAWSRPRARTDLEIVDVAAREASDGRELRVKNGGTEPADLTKAKIRDTSNHLYWLDVNAELSPGESKTFEIPEEFTLEPVDTGVELPLGWTLLQGADTPIIYSRAGEEMRLRRPDEA